MLVSSYKVYSIPTYCMFSTIVERYKSLWLPSRNLDWVQGHGIPSCRLLFFLVQIPKNCYCRSRWMLSIYPKKMKWRSDLCLNKIHSQGLEQAVAHAPLPCSLLTLDKDWKLLELQKEVLNLSIKHKGCKRVYKVCLQYDTGNIENKQLSNPSLSIQSMCPIRYLTACRPV